MQETQTDKNKRIFKNTIALYVRMVIVLLITLYTSRIVLKALGVEDFGLYNVVGGVVTLFAFIRTSMAQATQRYLNVEMVNPNGKLPEVFTSSLGIHILLAIVLLVICESIGLWFVNEKLQIPEGREIAANWVYQISVVSLLITTISVPYNAAIIAHENMTFFAIVGVVEAVLKLLAGFIILFADGDHLILYSCLLLLVTIISTLLLLVYCRKNYIETKRLTHFDKKLSKDIFGFVSWSLLGEGAIICVNQGNAFLVNMFHSVIANAAMSVGSQVNNAISGLATNFQKAFNPQITKSYAEDDSDYLKFLVFSTSKLSYLLLFIVSVPIVFNIDFVLDVWLETVPQYAAEFSVLFLVNGLINALSGPFTFCVMATGKIRSFQIVTTIVYLSDLIVLYILFRMGFPPVTAMYVKLGVMLIILFVRIFYAGKEVPVIKAREYLSHILAPLFITTVFTLFISCGLMCFAKIYGFVVLATICIIIISIALSYLLCLTKQERYIVVKFAKNVFVNNNGHV